jgi:hypothetical protein
VTIPGAIPADAPRSWLEEMRRALSHLPSPDLFKHRGRSAEGPAGGPMMGRRLAVLSSIVALATTLVAKPVAASALR